MKKDVEYGQFNNKLKKLTCEMIVNSQKRGRELGLYCGEKKWKSNAQLAYTVCSET
jgi:hypothetical protein